MSPIVLRQEKCSDVYFTVQFTKSQGALRCLKLSSCGPALTWRPKCWRERENTAEGSLPWTCSSGRSPSWWEWSECCSAATSEPFSYQELEPTKINPQEGECDKAMHTKCPVSHPNRLGLQPPIFGKYYGWKGVVRLFPIGCNIIIWTFIIIIALPHTKLRN